MKTDIPPMATAYIRRIRPKRNHVARLGQYVRVKDELLPKYPPEHHDAIIKAIAKWLKI